MRLWQPFARFDLWQKEKSKMAQSGAKHGEVSGRMGREQDPATRRNLPYREASLKLRRRSPSS
jgi:hypothetical protein